MHCRLELFTHGRRLSTHPMPGCITGRHKPDWKGKDSVPSEAPSIIRLADPGERSGRRLMACTECSCPCLLEAPPGALGCPAGNVRVRWFPAE